ncbi:response regulator, partial [bacterium]|nr:response regulator [bacterium]
AERIIHDVQEARSVFRPFLVSAQEVGPRSELLDPYRILKTTMDDIKQELPDRVQMETHIPDHPEYIKADASLFVKMIRNIVNNASESMEEPGIIKVIADVIILESKSGTTDALDLLPGRYIHLVISDQGSGLPSHMIQRAFQPFYTTKEKPHAGLGLTETLGIAKSHKGNVKMESSIGGGVMFHIYLPIIVCNAEADSLNGNVVKTSEGHTKKTILVVDDEENFLLSIGIRLKKFGYQVITASNGADALSKYNEHQTEIDLVITDNFMPVMDGPALIHALRKMSPSLKIILCTGLEAQNTMDELHALQVDETIFKPFSSAALLDLIKKHTQSIHD